MNTRHNQDEDFRTIAQAEIKSTVVETRPLIRTQAAREFEAETPLIQAILQQNLAHAAILIAAGADVNEKK